MSLATLPENLYLAWKRGAGERYRKLAQRFLLDKDYFEPLARGENVLPGRHAYSHMNALSSAMQAYFVDGNPKHFRAAKNGFDFVLAQSLGHWRLGAERRSFIALSLGELRRVAAHHPCGFGKRPAGLMVTSKGRAILQWRQRATSRYGDSMERVLYNTILGALPMKPERHGVLLFRLQRPRYKIVF